MGHEFYESPILQSVDYIFAERIYKLLWFLAGGTNSLWNFGDGTTNTFHAYTKNTLVDYEIYIYDRHGNMVFHSVDPLEGWDGTYKGKNCAQGAYVSLPPTNATTAAYAQ